MLGHIVVILCTALAALPGFLAARMALYWQSHCSGGRAAFPEFDVNDCGDAESSLVVLSAITGLFLIPLMVFLAASLFRRKGT